MNQSNASTAPESEKLSFATKLAFGAGDMGPAMTANILVFYLLPFFTNVAGLPANLAGSILLWGKISDAINDPLIGIASDRTRTRWGRRLPWMLFGIIPFGIVFFLQWIVPEFSSDRAVNTWFLFAYYIAIGVLFNLAYTAVSLPYQALTPELTPDYNERTSLNSFRFTFSIGASIFSLILAAFIFQAFPEDPALQYLILGTVVTVFSIVPLLWCTLGVQEKGKKTILNPAQKKYLGIFLTILGSSSFVYGILPLPKPEAGLLTTILLIFFGILLVTFGSNLIVAKPEASLNEPRKIASELSSNTENIPILQQLKIAFSNKAFLYVIGIYLCSWLSIQLIGANLIYFVVYWMGKDNAISSLVAVAVQGTALLLLFGWKILSDRYGKQAVYFMGTGVWIIAQIGLFTLQPGQDILMYCLGILAGFGVSVAYLIPWSMVPDVIELDELQTGQRREGIFYGFMVLLQKFGLAIALWLVGEALERSGFIETVAGQPAPIQPDSALLAIRIVIGPLPIVFLVCGLILAYFYPITREVHAEIRLKLKERQNNSPEA
ncbi:MAG: MFS transporter [Prochloraceae cyanobacterium]|nr:MFS transporter [Prochloraceae cyanobacterium]